MKTTIKPCPFCGCKDIHLTDVIQRDLPMQYQRWCDRCRAMTRETYGKSNATRLWNRRNARAQT